MKKVIYIYGRCRCGKIHSKKVRAIIKREDLEPVQCECGEMVRFSTMEVHSKPRWKRKE